MQTAAGYIYQERGSICKYGDTIVTAPMERKAFLTVLDNQGWETDEALKCPKNHRGKIELLGDEYATLKKGKIIIRDAVRCVYSDNAKLGEWRVDRGVPKEKLSTQLKKDGWQKTKEGWICPFHVQQPIKQPKRKTTVRK